MLKKLAYKSILLAILTITTVGNIFAENNHSSEESEKFNPVPVIMHHISDAHEWHLFGDVSVPLPVILWTDNGLVTFMSSAFHHNDDGTYVVEKNGMNFVKNHEKIYQLNAGETEAKFDEEHHITNAVKPTDISITKNVFAMLVSVLIILLVFFRVAGFYK